jgi:hypothetical protein
VVAVHSPASTKHGVRPLRQRGGLEGGYGIRVVERDGVSLPRRAFATYSNVRPLPISKRFFLKALLDIARPRALRIEADRLTF